ncbi:MAG: NAD+ synthase [Methanomassiliicoccales archaeon]|nr:NAD+ synthase [Methanomassiliicoccales archaeon]
MTDVVIKDFIRQKVEESGAAGVVVGLSGGIDSAVVAALCAGAIGGDKVLTLYLPSATSLFEDAKDAEELAQKFGMKHQVIDIEPAVDGFRGMLPELKQDKRLLGNCMARCRMTVLYDQAKLTNRLVMGTSNKSELLVGYFTKFGDGGADFCPIGDLYKTEVRQLARKIGVPEKFLQKAPSACLWKGQTDEGELGICYDDLDAVLFGIENGVELEEISRRNMIPQEKVEMVWKMHIGSVHKRKMPLIPKIGLRTIGLDWRE